MTTFAQVLDDLDARIDAVLRALAAGERPELPPFAPPRGAVPTVADLPRYHAVMERLADCQERLAAAQAETARGLADTDRRREAATAYLQADA